MTEIEQSVLLEDNYDEEQESQEHRKQEKVKTSTLSRKRGDVYVRLTSPYKRKKAVWLREIRPYRLLNRYSPVWFCFLLKFDFGYGRAFQYCQE